MNEFLIKDVVYCRIVGFRLIVHRIVEVRHLLVMEPLVLILTKLKVVALVAQIAHFLFLPKCVVTASMLLVYALRLGLDMVFVPFKMLLKRLIAQTNHRHGRHRIGRLTLQRRTTPINYGYCYNYILD